MSNNYVPLFLWFDHFLFFRAEIPTIFSLQFWKILDITISFWNKLTFKHGGRREPQYVVSEFEYKYDRLMVQVWPGVI